MQLTGGSSSVWSEYDRLKEVGAAAREMLIAAAAKTWKVSKASCRAKKSVVVHSGRKRLTYGQLAEEAAKMPVPAKIPLKKPSAFTIIGKPTKRLDAPEKTNGTAAFGIDERFPECSLR